MKIAISGKGGVGKSTIAAAISLLIANKGKKILALDADPDANLAVALGITSPKQKLIIPISQQITLIEERTGAKISQYGQMFKINPEVSDIADKYAFNYKGVELIVLGAVAKGGGGCACPESIFIKSLVTDLVLYKDEFLVMDMEAGVEHLGRATASGVDNLIIVIEPGQRSIDCANRIIKMANEIGIKKIQFVANKIAGEDDKKFFQAYFTNYEYLAYIPYFNEIKQADRNGKSVLDNINSEIKNIFLEVLKKLNI